MKILLLEDDSVLAESLREYLEMEGYEVEAVQRGEEVFDRTFEKRYDLYILDINVPDVNGLDVLEALKEADDRTPTIYISALRDIASITRGFDLGAVDYLKKPFDPEELLLRIRHHLVPREEERLLHYGELVFDSQSGRVERGEEQIRLGEVQKRIFTLLLERQGQLVASDELLELLERPNANALRVMIAKLKKRLGIEIINIRGQGYLLEKV
ncbi:response regulator transcription factor [Nitratifractor sp.]